MKNRKGQSEFQDVIKLIALGLFFIMVGQLLRMAEWQLYANLFSGSK